MKILIIMDPGILIPVTGYGGHERLVEMFAKEYRKSGHEVHLLVTNGSYAEGCVMHGLGKSGFPPAKKDARKAIFTAWKFLRKHRNSFDLIHNFGRLIYLLPVLNKRVKKIMTYGREISAKNIKLLLQLPNKNLVFTGCSNDLIKRAAPPGNWHTVYNAIGFDKYQPVENTERDAPLIFLGRIEKIKGCHTAIAAAKATNNKLIIAGNISPLAEEKEYFEKQIKPFIDGHQVKYVGAVDDAQKNYWLGQSKALLFLIEWNEPFGIAMIEAMACGTPVIAYRRGSVEEVINESATGFVVNDITAAIEKIGLLSELNRLKVREIAQCRFNVSEIAAKYLSLHDV